MFKDSDMAKTMFENSAFQVRSFILNQFLTKFPLFMKSLLHLG